MSANPSLRLTPVQLQAMARINRYLARLDLEEGQNLWLKTEVLKELERLDAASSVESVFGQSFAILQQRLGDLYHGEEWEGRLGLKRISQIARPQLTWNRPKALRRTPMASLPFDRSWRSAGQRAWRSFQSVLPALPLREIAAFPTKVFARN